MSVTVFAVTADLLSKEPRVHEAGLDAADVRAIVEAIAALPDVDDVAWPVFRGDAQFGHCATRVLPDRLMAVIDGLGGRLVEATAPLMRRALAEGWLMTVEEGLDWPGYARITLGTEKVGEVQAQMSSSSAAHAFATVGYAFDSSEVMDVSARELADRCAGSLDPLVGRLAAVAAYAMGVAGPGATVRAA